MTMSENLIKFCSSVIASVAKQSRDLGESPDGLPRRPSTHSAWLRVALNRVEWAINAGLLAMTCGFFEYVLKHGRRPF